METDRSRKVTPFLIIAMLLALSMLLATKSPAPAQTERTRRTLSVVGRWGTTIDRAVWCVGSRARACVCESRQAKEGIAGLPDFPLTRPSTSGAVATVAAVATRQTWRSLEKKSMHQPTSKRQRLAGARRASVDQPRKCKGDST